MTAQCTTANQTVQMQGGEKRTTAHTRKHGAHTNDTLSDPSRSLWSGLVCRTAGAAVCLSDLSLSFPLLLPSSTMIPPMVSTYAPSIALWVLVFLTVRGLLWAIWATLLRPAKNIKKTYVRGPHSAIVWSVSDGS